MITTNYWELTIWQLPPVYFVCIDLFKVLFLFRGRKMRTAMWCNFLSLRPGPKHPWFKRGSASCTHSFRPRVKASRPRQRGEGFGGAELLHRFKAEQRREPRVMGRRELCRGAPDCAAQTCTVLFNTVTLHSRVKGHRWNCGRYWFGLDVTFYKN